MPESSGVVRPVSPDSPSYSAAARLQAAGLPEAIALFSEAALTVPLPRPPQPIVIADYGAANGHNSLLPVTAAVSSLRSRTRPEHPILVAHTDIAQNDFSALFHTVGTDPDSYLRRDRAVFSSAVGRSFYQQILPTQSVNLGWSSWAIQWLSRLPAPIPDHLLPASSADDQARTSCARQAAEDWHEFVAFRGRELAPGGRLVVLTLGVDDSGAPGLQPLIEAAYATLKELADSGVISTDELAAMALPIVGRSARDFAAPFAPSGKFEGLSIERLDAVDAEDRFFKQFQNDSKVNTFGAQWSSFFCAVVLDPLTEALSGGRTDPRRAQLAEALQNGIAARLIAAPEAMRIPLVRLVLAKAS